MADVQSMSPPDLSTEEGREAYRTELRKAGFWPRQIGYGLVIAGAITVLWLKYGHQAPNPRLETAALAVCGIGWLLLIVAILMRSRYRRRLGSS